MHSGLQLRSDYAHSPEGLSELTKLIRDVFGVDISPLNTLGHDPSVVAFGWWRGGELVANVSLYQRQLWLSGEQVRAYGVQSVAVRPELRGQGLFRDLMHRALDYADARVSLVTLATGTPNLYAPFGFRSLRASGSDFSPGCRLRSSRTFHAEGRRMSGDRADTSLRSRCRCRSQRPRSSARDIARYRGAFHTFAGGYRCRIGL